MGRLKIIFEAHRRFFSRFRDAVVLPFRKAFARLFRANAFLSFRSRVRKLDIQAAHQVGMPVEEFDAKRRTFLKYAFFGSGLFLAGKYLNPLINTLRGDTVIDERVFRNFTLTETGKELRVTDDDGGEILTIDKESF